MSIALASSTINNIYLGSNQVLAAYLGTTQVFGGGVSSLPSGAVVVYDFADTGSWPGSGQYVYDLSGNGFTGTLYGTIGSGSVGALNFLSSDARVECTSSVFNSYMNQRQQLFAAVQYQTGSINGNTGFICTWGGTPDIGYNFFINAGANGGKSSVRTGVQVYAFDGSLPTGYYADPAAFEIATGSVSHTYAIMANAASSSAKIYNDGVNIGTLSGIASFKYFAYQGNAATGNGFRLGNFVLTGQNFRGDISKAVIYNRALTDSELAAIEFWMTS